MEDVLSREHIMLSTPLIVRNMPEHMVCNLYSTHVNRALASEIIFLEFILLYLISSFQFILCKVLRNPIL